jgi:hypothetical protein
MASVTWDGITVDFDNLAGYNWYNNTVTVNSVSYRLLQGYMVAGLREMDSAITGVGTTLTATSTTSETIGTGSKSLVIQTGKGFSAGNPILVTNTGTPANYMLGTVDSYNTDSGALAFTVASGDTGGSGTFTAWTVSISGVKGATGAPGGVTGPVSSTDNTWARFNGTAGDSIQGGAWTEDDSGNVTAGGALDMSGYDLTVDFTTVEAAGEHAEENDANATGTVTIQATDPTVLRRTLTGDVTLHVAGAPTPGKGWSTEFRSTQDGTGGRDVTILPANELTYSTDLQSTAEAGETRPWGDTSTSLTQNAALGPDGRTTLQKLIEDSGGGGHLRTRTVSGLSPNQILTASVILRDAGDDRKLAIYIYDGGATGNAVRVTFDPSTGTISSAASSIGNGAGAVAVVTELANSCFRLDLTGQPNTSGSNARIDIHLVSAAGSTSYTGDGTSGVYIGNVQVNTGQPIGMIDVATTRAASVVWRAGAANAIDYTAQAAAAESRIILGVGSDGEIMVDDVSVEA